VWLDPIQTRFTRAPVQSPGALTYWHQNQDVLRSGVRPTVPRPAHNSVRAASAISWRPTPRAPSGWPKKLFYSPSFSSSVASSDDGQACRSSNPDSYKTRCVAYRCSQTPPLAAEPPRGCGGGVLNFSVFHSSSHFTTHASRRKGVLPRRLPSIYMTSGTPWEIGSRMVTIPKRMLCGKNTMMTLDCFGR